MIAPLSDARIAQLETLESQATKGEWVTDYGRLSVPQRDKRGRKTGRGAAVIDIDYGYCECDTQCVCTGTLEVRSEDLDFIAAVRNDLAALLAEVKRGRETAKWLEPTAARHKRDGGEWDAYVEGQSDLADAVLAQLRGEGTT